MDNKTDSRADGARQPSNHFVSEQFAWLRQVAYDSALPPASSRVAAALTKYFSREHDGWSWMSQATLAHDLGMPERTVRYTLSAMIERGHLHTKRRGKMETNLYHLVIKNAESDRQPVADQDRQYFATHSGVTGKNLRSDRQDSVKVTGNPLPPNPLNDSNEEPDGEGLSPRLDLGDEDSRRRDQSDSPPDIIGADFEQFWRQYPKKVDKAAALKAYRGVIKKKLATPSELISGAMRYAADRNGQDPKYTKNPSTWLNAGSWSNEPTITAPIDSTGTIIDHDGNPIQQPPPWQQKRSSPTWDDLAGLTDWIGGAQ